MVQLFSYSACSGWEEGLLGHINMSIKELTGSHQSSLLLLGVCHQEEEKSWIQCLLCLAHQTAP